MSEILPICERYKSFISDTQEELLENKENEEYNPLDYILDFAKERTYHFQITCGGPNIWIYFFIHNGFSVPYRAFYYSTDGWEYQEYSLSDEQIEIITDLYGLNFEE